MIALLFAAAVAAAPSPSPTPLRTIVYTRVSPLCSALRQNLGHAIAAVLGNDGAIAASKPVLVSMSTDNMTPDQIETIGLGNVHGTMTVDHNSAAMQLDSQHLEQIISALTHSVFGRFYRIVFLEQQAITKLESPLAQNVIQITRACNGTP
ncbi:MAG TPA: hypothetical protein VFH72_10295 [Candidatus Baltobacteraceae bacterium]|nr:hypothetical protein [Candidatus Baltobacteraceae bacterium]